jgi:hypothetical protein
MKLDYLYTIVMTAIQLADLLKRYTNPSDTRDVSDEEDINMDGDDHDQLEEDTANDAKKACRQCYHVIS